MATVCPISPDQGRFNQIIWLSRQFFLESTDMFRTYPHSVGMPSGNYLVKSRAVLMDFRNLPDEVCLAVVRKFLDMLREFEPQAILCTKECRGKIQGRVQAIDEYLTWARLNLNKLEKIIRVVLRKQISSACVNISP